MICAKTICVPSAIWMDLRENCKSYIVIKHMCERRKKHLSFGVQFVYVPQRWRVGGACWQKMHFRQSKGCSVTTVRWTFHRKIFKNHKTLLWLCKNSKIHQNASSVMQSPTFCDPLKFSFCCEAWLSFKDPKRAGFSHLWQQKSHWAPLFVFFLQILSILYDTTNKSHSTLMPIELQVLVYIYIY